VSEQTKSEGMLCPVCSLVLVMTERQGVEIDYCPKCRGVWLDRGELDKILERASVEGRANPVVSPAPAAQNAAQPIPQSPWLAPPAYSDYRDKKEHDHEGRGDRRRSWLGDLFD
jgi:Zn-finger nucleic acid-binding protein